MADARSTADRQRRIAAYVFLAVGLVNLVVGAVAGAIVTIAISVVMLVVGGALLVSTITGGSRPPSG